jgi:hypothetical protein
MDFTAKQELVDRICQGRLYAVVEFKDQPLTVTFTDPTREDLQYANFLSNTLWKDDGSCLTQEEAIQLLIEQGEWSEEMDSQLTDLEESLQKVKKELVINQYHSTKKAFLEDVLINMTKDIDALNKKKYQLWDKTVEYSKLIFARRWLIKKLAQVHEPEYHKFLENFSFVDTLTVYYYDRGLPETKDIRLIARSEPWRLIWNVSKDTKGQLFRNDLYNLTDLQYQLVLWSKIYDFAYNHTESPSEDIIDNDDQFDAWYKEAVEEMKSKQQNSNNSNSHNKRQHQHKFVLADKEGARKVWDMNSPAVRAEMAQRQKMINEKGAVKETEFPDAQLEIAIMKNNKWIEAQKKRK